MNTPSRSLAGLNRIVGVMLLLFLVAAPGALAIELKVVGDNDPIDATLLFTASGPEYCSIFASPTLRFHIFDLADCVLAQAFSLSSGTYVNQLKLGLFGSMEITPPVATTYALRITIASSLGGTPVLDLHELVPLPSSTGTNLTPTPPFSVSFPAIFLPKGTYYMVLSEDGTFVGNVGDLLWAANKVGSPEVGTLGSAFGFCQASDCTPAGWQVLTVDPKQTSNLAGTNGTFAFELDGPLAIPSGGGGRGQILRLVAGPIAPAPGTPVEAQLGFVDLNGSPIGPTSTVTIGPGQIQSLDLNLSQFVNQLGQHIEVVPVVTQPPNAAGAPPVASQLLVTTQIVDALTGFETVLTPTLQPGSSAPALAPQVLAGGQTMRMTVIASNTDPCNADLSFADKDGIALGPSEPVSVSPGTGTSLDLNANTLGLTLGKRIEVLPIVTPTALPGAAPVNSVCQVTVEVFDHLTGRTESSQSTTTALPAVQ